MSGKKESYKVKIWINGVEKELETKIKINLEEIPSEASKYYSEENGMICINEKFFDDSRKVPPDSRFIIDIDCKGVITNAKIGDSNPKLNKYIFLVLESPHRDEYTWKSECLTPSKPAQGTTGMRIEENLEYVLMAINPKLGNSLEVGKYEVILINPVPFQASLGSLYTGEIQGELRNEIWTLLWKDTKCKDEFLGTIAKKQQDVKLIINSCTIQLQKHVQQALTEPNKGYQIVKMRHPSQWNLGIDFTP
ncbi:hypothetical protein HB943_13385 [Listeria weihenstephanensis]|uniref:Uncharacterized protein n=1 Tax=Listeria weihenstephanensis TaxID=1006155 RepID=A0A841Z8S7_9LIST|nr:hypothetical protein [Listeria weihenstephanensis]MBC1501594.1 hypothetical protein [Listeria weihenstephanensis]